jgi:hypothetical protein
MRLVLGVALVIAVASTASAQSAYVGASFIGDIVKVSGSSYGDGTGGGETFGGALRAGVALGERWGVELEYARTGEIEARPNVFLAQASFTLAPFDEPSYFPIPEFSSERQLSTISTLLWWSHEMSQRFSLVYLGGVAFTRTAFDLRVGYPLPVGPPIPVDRFGSGIAFPRVIEQESTSYGADVAVGIEGRIGMTDHLRLTPGLRLHTVPGGWAIRPGVGLQWMF